MLRRRVMLGGAGGMIGAENVARATSDGTTLGVIGISALCAFPTLYDRVPYHALRDFSPVTQITSGVQLWVVNADIARRNNWPDFSAMIRWARANSRHCAPSRPNPPSSSGSARWASSPPPATAPPPWPRKFGATRRSGVAWSRYRARA